MYTKMSKLTNISLKINDLMNFQVQNCLSMVGVATKKRQNYLATVNSSLSSCT